MLIPPCSPFLCPLLRLLDLSRVLRSSIYEALDRSNVLSYHTIKGEQGLYKLGGEWHAGTVAGATAPAALPVRRGWPAQRPGRASRRPRPAHNPHSSSGSPDELWGLAFQSIICYNSIADSNVSQRNFKAAELLWSGVLPLCCLHQIVI